LDRAVSRTAKARSVAADRSDAVLMSPGCRRRTKIGDRVRGYHD
jgi:hypothetical protein